METETIDRPKIYWMLTIALLFCILMVQVAQLMILHDIRTDTSLIEDIYRAILNPIPS